MNPKKYFLVAAVRNCTGQKVFPETGWPNIQLPPVLNAGATQVQEYEGGVRTSVLEENSEKNALKRTALAIRGSGRKWKLRKTSFIRPVA